VLSAVDGFPSWQIPIRVTLNLSECSARSRCFRHRPRFRVLFPLGESVGVRASWDHHRRVGVALLHSLVVHDVLREVLINVLAVRVLEN